MMKTLFAKSADAVDKKWRLKIDFSVKKYTYNDKTAHAVFN
jgi:hypothetical protein